MQTTEMVSFSIRDILALGTSKSRAKPPRKSWLEARHVGAPCSRSLPTPNLLAVSLLYWSEPAQLGPGDPASRLASPPASLPSRPVLSPEPLLSALARLPFSPLPTLKATGALRGNQGSKTSEIGP